MNVWSMTDIKKKNQFQESIPLGATNVTKYTVQKLINFIRPNTFLLTRKEGKTIYLSTESLSECESWISLISNTAKHQVSLIERCTVCDILIFPWKILSI